MRVCASLLYRRTGSQTNVPIRTIAWHSATQFEKEHLEQLQLEQLIADSAIEDLSSRLPTPDLSEGDTEYGQLTLPVAIGWRVVMQAAYKRQWRVMDP